MTRTGLPLLLAVLLAIGAGCDSTPDATDDTTDTAVAPPRPEDTEVWEPEPAVVAPGRTGASPSDAVVLFDGTDLTGWTHEEGSATASEGDGTSRTAS